MYHALAIRLSPSLLLLLLQYAFGTAAYYTTMYHGGNGKWEGYAHMTRMFAFGASYTATGFDWKNGIQPGPHNALGNPSTYKGHTASNGPNFIMYMTTKYNQSFVQTYDFAWAGSPVPGVVGQVKDDFAPHFTGGAKLDPGWSPSRTLFPIFVGINDLNHWNTASKTAAGLAAYRDGVFTQYAGAIDTLYHKGARNIVVYNVPPLERAPAFKYVVAAKRGEVNDYNNRLKAMAAHLSQKYKDAIIWHVDMNALFNDALNNKNRFAQTKGYRALTGNCAYYATNWLKLPSMTYKDKSCAYPVNEYFWLNGGHPTYPAHDLLAEVTHDALEKAV